MPHWAMASTISPERRELLIAEVTRDPPVYASFSLLERGDYALALAAVRLRPRNFLDVADRLKNEVVLCRLAVGIHISSGVVLPQRLVPFVDMGVRH